MIMDFGLNIVTDISVDYAVKVAKLAENLGFKTVWIGETLGLKHPFKYLHNIASSTRKIVIGTSVLSIYTNSVKNVAEYFADLVNIYGQRFIIGLGIGDKKLLKLKKVTVKQPLKDLDNYVRKLEMMLNNYNLKIPIIIGSMGPTIVKYSCKTYGSILLNTIYPDYIRWVLKILKDIKCDIYSIGPCLLEGDVKNFKAVKVAAGIVLRGMNKHFLKAFKLTELAKEIDIALENKNYTKLEKYRELLLEKFAIYGTIEQVLERVRELEKLNIKHLIFGTPLYRNINQIKILSGVLNLKY